jgi:phage N-6-adenine-methyltransferase
MATLADTAMHAAGCSCEACMPETGVYRGFVSAPTVLNAEDRSLWRTPTALFTRLDHEFHFAIDLAADGQSTLVPGGYFGPDHPSPDCRDALAARWNGEDDPGFLNPPWSPRAGLELAPWPIKCFYEMEDGFTTVALLPVATSTRWWTDAVMKADEIRLINHRLRYLRPNGMPSGTARFDSAVVVFRPSIGARKCGPRIFPWDYR